MRATRNAARGLPCVLVLVAGLCVVASAAAQEPAVADAAKRQDWAVVQELLRGGADVNLSQGDGATALHWAVYWDERDAVQLLLSSGAAIDAANDLGVTPLWLAANNGSAHMVEALLAAGAGANAALPSGETPLMTASRAGNKAAVRALLARGADPHAREGAHGQTALMWAVAQRHPGIVRALLAGGARVDDRSHSYPQVVSSSGNADPKGVFEVRQGGYTPLLFAARQGDLASARLLVEAGADVNEAPASGTTPLVVAAHSGHGALAAWLLEAGADPDAAGAGYSALHAAVLRGDRALVRALLDHAANPDAVMTRGSPARRVSADWRLPHRMIGATPLWTAAWFREPQLVQLLADHGADPRATVGGETAVMAAIRGRFSRGRFGVVRPPAEVEAGNAAEAAAVAIDAGADVSGRNGTGDTALHMAVAQRLNGVITVLAERGAEIDARNRDGKTPLDLALANADGAADEAGDSTVTLLRSLGAADPGGTPAAAR
ncbi:MAG: ankyrin repeat domain-containing protein [Acidobacteria bacterium]|nr:ankyrin repeat domain-containing protein [Acidobacteriota bacterium]